MRASRWITVAAAGGVVLGAVAGLVLAVGATRAGAGRQAAQTPAGWIDATHLPPLLTAPGERVELRYDVYCGDDTDADADAPCDASGAVFVRTGDRGAFARIPLRIDPGAVEGRYVADVPTAVADARDGFSYYAVFTRAGGPTLVTPAGGAEAPQRSLPLGRSVGVELGSHDFGRTRSADARVAEAAWGDGPGDVGLEQGRNLPPIGGASFDVDEAGRVALLDEAHKRLLRWSDSSKLPSRQALAIEGTIADLALAPGGTAYVLESTGAGASSNTLRAFRPDGSVLSVGETAERASEVRLGANGDAMVLQDRSGEWTTAAAAGRVLSPASQRRSGHASRSLPDGSDVVVLRRGNEIRLALIGRDGVRRNWRVSSGDPLAEVQLAEPLGRNLVVVARVYSDEHDEFVVLVLGARGLVRSFSVADADWAETAPLSRFRLVGSSLYRLGSTPRVVFVDRYDLEVK